MNRLFIIGNGFDLAHGLKTRYEDFLLWYLKSAAIEAHDTGIYKDVNLIISWEKVKGISHKHWFDKCENSKELIDNLKQNSFKIEYKSIFFQRIIETSYSNWVNIENTYYKILKIHLRNQTKVRKNLVKLNIELSFIVEKLTEYISTIDKNDVSKIKPENKYLDIFKKKHHEIEFYEVENEVKKGGIKVFKNLVLNFNYTALIENYIKILKKENKDFEQIQIHGSASDPNTIVFGFGDELDEDYHEMEKKNNNEFFKHIKSFKYFQDDNYQKLMAFIEGSEPFEVIVLGHSLGLSDRTMLSQIFEHKNLERVQLYYYEGEKGNDFTEKTYEISRHFSDKGRMRLKVVPFTASEAMPQVE